MASSSYKHKDVPHNYTLFVFEGSDWCVNCRRLEKNILSDTKFVSFLEQKHITLRRVDFPQRKVLDAQTKKHNETLAEQYNFDGAFPTLILSREDTLLFRKIYYNKKQAPSDVQTRILTHLKSLQ